MKRLFTEDRKMTQTSQADPGIIFINYRRTDTGWSANNLRTALESAFGRDRVFQDVRDIDAGDDYSEELEEQVSQATILLVLIGKTWLFANDKYGRRRLAVC